MDDLNTLIWISFAAVMIVMVMASRERVPVIICPHCRYHNRPRNRRCWWCGKPR